MRKVILISIIPLLFILFYLFCYSYTPNYKVSIERNILNEIVQIDTLSGHKISPPWVQVSRIDIRPHRVCIECGCRNINCRLVSFNPNGWKSLVEREGFHYYWLTNLISFNSAHEHEYRGMINILRGYAFDKNPPNFVKVEKIDTSGNIL